MDGIIGRVERVISEVSQSGALLHVVVASLKLEQACAEIVVDEVPATLPLYILRIIEVGVIALGHGV